MWSRAVRGKTKNHSSGHSKPQVPMSSLNYSDAAGEHDCTLLKMQDSKRSIVLRSRNDDVRLPHMAVSTLRDTIRA